MSPPPAKIASSVRRISSLQVKWDSLHIFRQKPACTLFTHFTHYCIHIRSSTHVNWKRNASIAYQKKITPDTGHVIPVKKRWLTYESPTSKTRIFNTSAIVPASEISYTYLNKEHVHLFTHYCNTYSQFHTSIERETQALPIKKRSRRTLVM